MQQNTTLYEIPRNSFTQQIQHVLAGFHLLSKIKPHWFMLVDIDEMRYFGMIDVFQSNLRIEMQLPLLTQEEKRKYGFVPINVSVLFEDLQAIWCSMIFLAQYDKIKNQTTEELKAITRGK